MSEVNPDDFEGGLDEPLSPILYCMCKCDKNSKVMDYFLAYAKEFEKTVS